MDKDEFEEYTQRIVYGDQDLALSYANTKEAFGNVFSALNKGVFKADEGWVVIIPGHEVEVAQELLVVACDMAGWDDLVKENLDDDADD